MEILTNFLFGLEQRTPEWELERKNTITGSMAGAFAPKVRGSGLRGEYYAFLADDIDTEAHTGNPMDWGTEKEPMARAKYEQITGNKVIECGFVRHPKYNFLGYSPDGLVMRYNEIHKVDLPSIGLEMKCPTTKVYVEYFIENCLDEKDEVIEPKGFKAVPDEYKKQVVHSFICNIHQEELHFFIFNPTLEKNNYILIVVKREEIVSEIEEMLAYEIIGYNRYLKHKELFINF